MEPSLQYNGRFYRAQKRIFNETIFFVHFYLGSQSAIRKHIEMVNSLGFDAFAFDLISNDQFLRSPLSQRNQYGIKHLWADQIEFFLNQIPGNKIVYAFSNPSASAIEALFYRNTIDIVGLVCDSGPSIKIINSVLNYIRHMKNQSYMYNFTQSLFIALIWGPELNKDLHRHLKEFRRNFPILSIRGWKDSLIPPHDIDEVFEMHAQLNWRKLSLPQAAHLNGLRDFSDIYIPGVKKFLEEIGSRINPY